MAHRSAIAYRQSTARLLAERVASLDADAGLEALRAARAWHSHAIYDLHDHLVARPDALRSGASDCPLSLIRLIGVLVEAGHVGLVAPRCVRCGTAARDMPGVCDGGRICLSCYRQANKQPCARCGRVTKAAYRRPEGLICQSCRDAEPDSQGICTVCGHHRPLRLGRDGQRRCPSCVPRPLRTCASCGRSAIANAITADGPLCAQCYWKKHARLCGGCGRVRPICRKATATEPDLCLSCCPRSIDVCAGCGRRTYGNRTDRGRGAFLCQTCQPKRIQRCGLCGRRRQAGAIWPLGPVCRSCYAHAKHFPAGCAGCGDTAVLIGVEAHGHRICGTCAGVDRDYRCQRCDAGGIPFSHGLCDRCTLNDEIGRLLDTAADPDALQPLATALRATGNPRNTIRWLRHQPAGQLLTRLLREGQPLTHALLDRQRPTQHLHRVRHILVRTGVLPERNEYLERIPPWLGELLRDQPAAHAALVRRYARWYLLPRARRRARTRIISAPAAYHIHSQLRTVLGFLRWLDTHDQTLNTLTQHALDTWLGNAPTGGWRIRQFLTWAHHQHQAPQLVLPAAVESPTELRLLDHTDLYHQLRRCLHDTDLPLDVRVAGALLHTFGIRLSRLVQLTTDTVATTLNGVQLTVGRAPILVPPPINALLTELAAKPRDPAALSRAVGPSRYLFPGAAPGKPMRSAGMHNRLRRHGITAEPGRQTALLALAADLPAPIAADLLGITTNTALRWAQHTHPDWTTYLNARQNTPSPRNTTHAE